jgi:hypothetical protein
MLSAEPRKAMGGEGYLELQNTPGLDRTGEEWTGWVDLRHPGDGTLSAMSPYDRSNRFVMVNPIRVNSTAAQNGGMASIANFARDFDYANKIYAQAGLSILSERTSPRNTNIADEWPINNSQLNLMFLMDGARSASARTLNNYYVRSYDPAANGKSLAPFALENILQGQPAELQQMFRGRHASSISDVARTSTLAHELGHMLLNADSAFHQNCNMPPDEPPAESCDVTNWMFLTGEFAPANLESVGVNGRRSLMVTPQLERIFASAGAGMPAGGFVQRPTAAQIAAQKRYGNRVDWDFVVDHGRVTLNVNHDADRDPQGTTTPNIDLSLGVEDGANGADNQKGFDALYFGINAAAQGPADQTGHVHRQGDQDLGQFKDTGNFGGATFRFADIFSLSLRYSDFDAGADAVTRLKNGALDYDVVFRNAAGETQPGTPVVSFTPGWSTSTEADNFLTRWKAPFDATGLIVVARSGDGHDHIAQLDAVIVSAVPEPGAAFLALAALLSCGMRPELFQRVQAVRN